MPGLSKVPSPQDIVRHARPGRSVVGWKLDRAQRAELLAKLDPKYGKVVADHVTLAANVARDTPLPDAVTGEAVGDRKSTRLNSSHVKISYAVFCLKKKTKNTE